MGNFDIHPFAQILGLETENQHIKNTIIFLATLGVVQDLEQKYAKNVVQFVGVSVLRCIGGFGLLLPLLLSKMPGSLLSEFDMAIYMVFGAICFSFFLSEFIPADVADYLVRFEGLASAIFRANQSGLAYALGVQAFPNSSFAPFLCAYIGCNGQEFILNGIGYVNGPHLESNEILAVFGGPLYWFLATQVGSDALYCRVALVFFRLSADQIDYDRMFNNFVRSLKATVTSMIPSMPRKVAQSPKMRSRSRSMKRRSA